MTGPEFKADKMVHVVRGDMGIANIRFVPDESMDEVVVSGPQWAIDLLLCDLDQGIRERLRARILEMELETMGK